MKHKILSFLKKIFIMQYEDDDEPVGEDRHYKIVLDLEIPAEEEETSILRVIDNIEHKLNKQFLYDGCYFKLQEVVEFLPDSTSEEAIPQVILPFTVKDTIA